MSCLGGLLAVARRLVGMGADVNTKGGDLGTPLHAAITSGNRDLVQLFLDNGADINAQGGRYGITLQALIERGHLKISCNSY
ncbi:hypothetical protein L209DRAFT_756008 [Thermothelomyces heterothallicus CBS 203.75]